MKTIKTYFSDVFHTFKRSRAFYIRSRRITAMRKLIFSEMAATESNSFTLHIGVPNPSGGPDLKWEISTEANLVSPSEDAALWESLKTNK